MNNMNIPEEDPFDLHTDPLLLEASRLNGDLGRFVRTCTFSTQLSGRFYQNNSMETHTAREKRIARMQAKKKKLERDLKLEDARIKYFEQLLVAKEEERQRKIALLDAATRAAAIKIQSAVRACLAKNKMELLQVEKNITLYVAKFLQSFYRGIRDRNRVEVLKLQKMQARKQGTAAIQIQQQARGLMAKRQFQFLRQCMIQRRRNHFAALRIQTLLRGRVCRLTYKKQILCKNELKSATLIQRTYRGMIGRHIAQMARKEKQKKNQKRVPLYERRYSSYSVDKTNLRVQRRFSEISLKVPDRVMNRPINRSEEPSTDASQSMVLKGPDRDAVKIHACSATLNESTVEHGMSIARQKAVNTVSKLKRGAQVERRKKKRQDTSTDMKEQPEGPEKDQKYSGSTTNTVQANPRDKKSAINQNHQGENLSSKRITHDSVMIKNDRSPSIGYVKIARFNTSISNNIIDENFEDLVPEHEFDLG